MTLENPKIEVSAGVLKSTFWRVEGSDKSPLVFVHGGPGLFGYMKGLAEDLCNEGHSVVDYYQRGRRYQTGNHKISVADHQEDLQAVTQFLGEQTGVAKPMALAHSWGGLLTLLTQARFELFSKIILINPMPFSTDGIEIFANEIFSRLTDEEMRVRQERQEKLMVMPYGEQKEALFCQMSDDVYKVYQKTNLEVPFSHILDKTDVRCFYETHGDLAPRMATEEVKEQIRKVQCPVHMIYGEYDPCPGPLVIDQIKPLLKSFQWSSVGDCGHYPWFEKAETWQLFRQKMIESFQ